MKFFLRSKPLAVLLVLTFGISCISWSPAKAAMVSTSQLVEQGQIDPARDRVLAFLERSEIQAQLQSWGVDSDEAKARVENLTDKEVAELAEQLDNLPHGGTSAGLILAVVFGILVILVFHSGGALDRLFKDKD